MVVTPDSLKLALQHQREGRADEAEQVYRQILEQQPESVDALNLLGALIYQQGRFQEAVACFEQVLTLQPDNPDSYNSMGVVLKGQGKAEEAVNYYRQALDLRPEHPEVHNNLGNALRQLGDVEGAIAAYQQAISLKPNYPEAHNNLGAALKDCGKYEEALPHYQTAIALNPNYAEAYHNLGAAWQRLGKVDEAKQAYQQALTRKPNYPEVYNGLGNLCQQQGNFDEAIRYHEQAIALRPNFPEAHHSLANALQQQGKLEEAVAKYEQALELRPDYPEACSNLGNALQEQGKLEDAIAQYRRALELRPNFAEAHSNLGAALKEQRKLDEAIAHFQEAIALRPDYAEVHNNLGNVYQEQGRFKDAIASYERALEIRPNFAEIHSNLGNILQQEGRFEEAFEHFAQAIEVQPEYAGAYNNLGIALRNQGRMQEASEAYEKAIAIDPEFVEAHWNKALNLLLMGDLKAGFAGYEWRFQWSRFKQQTPPRPYTQPRWDGASLEGKTIFLYAEQGMGDTIQFIRYAPLVAKRGGRVIVECHPPLVELFRTLPGIHQVIPYGSPIPPFDVHAPLMSLPHILGTTLETIPAVVGYLGEGEESRGKGASEELRVKSEELEGRGQRAAERQGWGDREGGAGEVDGEVKNHSSFSTSNSKLSTLNSQLLTLNSPLRVGIVWSGNPENPYNRARTFPLELLLTLTDLPGVRFFSLQKEPPIADLPLLQAHPEVEDWRDRLTSFVATASLVEQLDLVIAVDTAAAHLAGALGKQVWLLLPSAADWRWMLEREDSPWYPTMRLFRQPAFGDWESVLERVRGELTHRSQESGVRSQEGEGSRVLVVGQEQVSGVGYRVSGDEGDGGGEGERTVRVFEPIPEELKVAVQHQQAGRLQEAKQICRQILERQEHPEVWHLLGLIAHRERNFEEAITLYRKVLEQVPNHQDVCNNLAVALHEQGKLDEAIAQYQQALRLKPDYADAHNNYANALRSKGQLEEAIHHYRMAIAYNPGYADAFNNLGLALYAQGEFAQAADCYRQAVTLRPNFPQAHNHLGNAYKELGDFKQAAEHYQQAIALKPNYAKAFNNWGNIFRDEGDLTTALQHYDRAITIEPEFAEAHWNKALTLLIGGDLRQGFVEYEWRWRVNLPSFHPMRPFAAPLWDGSPLNGKTIFLHAEQGMGDIIQFVRYTAIVAEQGGRIILECHPPLVNLLKDIPHIHQVIPYGSQPVQFDVHAPLMSLAHILGTTLDSVPAKVPYLGRSEELEGKRQKAEGRGQRAAETKGLGDRESGAGEEDREVKNHSSLSTLNSQLFTLNSSLKVGIVWSGNPENPYNRSRTVPLEQLLSLAKIPGICLYSLQKDPAPDDLQLLASHPEVVDLREQLTDFVQTAALIKQLDLVISIDTAVTHLTGALAKPVWLLLPYAPDWRWMLERDDSPWYPTMRLFRQTDAGNWNPVIDRVQHELSSIAQRKLNGSEVDTQTLMSPVGAGKKQSGKKKQAKNSQKKLEKSTALSPQMGTVATNQLLTTAYQLYNASNLTEAEQICQRILEQQPNQTEALHLSGVILCRTGRSDSAIARFQQVLQLQPNFADAWCNLGSALREQGRLEEAKSHYERAIALNPDHADAHYNLAMVLQEQDQLEAALTHCKRTAELKPDFVDAHYSMGFVLRRLVRLDEAIACYRRAIQLSPNYPEAHKNLGHALLLTGEFQQGFAEYEWRWRQKGWSTRPFTQPLWDGSPLNGKTILLHAEQGIGDSIQFIRYVPLVKQLGGRAIVECPPALFRLLENFPDIDHLIVQGSSLPQFDVHAPLMSLPHILGTTLETVPADIPYLGSGRQKAEGRRQKAEGKRQKAEGEGQKPEARSQEPDGKILNSQLFTLHSQLSTLNSQLKVGIVWAGNPDHKNNRYRSCELSWFSLLNLPGVAFYSLQKGEAAYELRTFSAFDIQDMGRDLNDFADTASAIDQLDLVISVDTAVAHLAGAMGKPTWLLLSYSPDWRWMLERDDSPWYPTMRLFRQTQPGDWQSVFERVGEELEVESEELEVESEELKDESEELEAKSRSEVDPEGGKILIPSSGSAPKHSANNMDPCSHFSPVNPFGGGLGDAIVTQDGGFGGLSPQAESFTKTNKTQIALTWQPDLLSNTGILGTYLSLQLLKNSQFQPVFPDHTVLSSLPPLYQALLKPTLATQPQNQADTQQYTIHILDSLLPTPQKNEDAIALFTVTNPHLTSAQIAHLKTYSHLLTGCTWSTQLLKQHGLNPTQIRLQAIDPTLFHPGQKANLFSDRFVIFSSGTLSYANGQDIVIAAFKAFQSRHPEALLLTSWNVKDLNALTGFDQLAISPPTVTNQGQLSVSQWLTSNGLPTDSFIDLGVVPYNELGQILREANVAIFPSRCEVGTNQTAIASLACGIPTILSANTGNLDLTRQNLGYPLQSQRRIKPNSSIVSTDGWGESDVEEIVETLERIYRDRQEATHRGLIAADFVKDWTWENLAANLLAILPETQPNP